MVKSPEFPEAFDVVIERSHNVAPLLSHLKPPLARNLTLDRTHSSVHKLSDTRFERAAESLSQKPWKVPECSPSANPFLNSASSSACRTAHGSQSSALLSVFTQGLI